MSHDPPINGCRQRANRAAWTHIEIAFFFFLFWQAEGKFSNAKNTGNIETNKTDRQRHSASNKAIKYVALDVALFFAYFSFLSLTAHSIALHGISVSRFLYRQYSYSTLSTLIANKSNQTPCLWYTPK